MHFFEEDVSRCFSEQAKIVAAELNIPLNVAREFWARVHGCENAHEATQKIKKQCWSFGESVIASKRTLGRFPHNPFIDSYFPLLFRKSCDMYPGPTIDGIDPALVARAALKAKGIPRRLSADLPPEAILDLTDSASKEFAYNLEKQGGARLATEEDRMHLIVLFCKSLKRYMRQRRVRGVLLGFQDRMSTDDLVHNTSVRKVFDIWSVSELIAIFNRQVRRDKNGGEASFWEDRAALGATAILGLIAIARPDATLEELGGHFQFDRMVKLRDEVKKNAGLAGDPETVRVVNRLDLFLESLPGFHEEDWARQSVSSEVYNQYGFLSMQFTSCLSSFAEENDLEKSNLFPDMAIPRSKDQYKAYFGRLRRILKVLPDYSIAFIDGRRLGGDESQSKEIVEQVVQICKDHRVYAIWCGNGSDSEQEPLEPFYDELFEVTPDLQLRPFF